MRPAKIEINNKKGLQYITYAESLRRDLDDYRDRYGFPFISKEYTLDNGTRIIILSSDINPRITILTKDIINGFATHPKSGAFKSQSFSKTDITDLGPVPSSESHYVIDHGGWDEDIKDIVNKYHIAYVDDDGGTSVLTPKEEGVFEETHGEYSYGNIYWTNGKDILSWKGPLGKHIPAQDTVNIPGYTTLDDRVSTATGDIDYYTPFDTKVYSKGKVLAEAPEYNWSGFNNKPKILGSSYITDSRGLRWLVIVCGVNKRNHPDERGFFDTVFISKDNTTWERIGEYASSRHRTPYFFNSLGTQAVNRDKLITIDIDNKTSSIEILPNRTELEISIPSYWDASCYEVSTQFREFRGTELIEYTVTSNIKDNTILDSTTTDTEATLPVYEEGGLDCPTLEGPVAVSVGSVFSLSGGEFCPENVRWSFSGGTIDAITGEILSITGCGVGTVTATLETCTLSKEVRLPSGVWVLQSATNPSGGPCYLAVCNDYGQPGYVEDIDGIHKYAFYYFWDGWATVEEYNSTGFLCEKGFKYTFKSTSIPVFQNTPSGTAQVDTITHFPYKTVMGETTASRVCNPGCGNREGYFRACGVCGGCLVGLCYVAECRETYKWECP